MYNKAILRKISFASYIKTNCFIGMSIGFVFGIVYFVFIHPMGILSAAACIITLPLIFLFVSLLIAIISYFPFTLLISKCRIFDLFGYFEIYR